MAIKLKKKVMKRISRNAQEAKRRMHTRVQKGSQPQKDIQKIIAGAIQDFQSDLKYLEDR